MDLNSDNEVGFVDKSIDSNEFYFSSSKEKII
jgi:hypothetical protein